MIEEENLKEKLTNYISELEKIGENRGGSGHLGYKSLEIKNISEMKENKQIYEELFVILVEYRIIIETEFTYYPDNPPYEYEKHLKIYIDNNGDIKSHE